MKKCMPEGQTRNRLHWSTALGPLGISRQNQKKPERQSHPELVVGLSPGGYAETPPWRRGRGPSKVRWMLTVTEIRQLTGAPKA
jgi:hypothetical protein